MKSNDLAQVGRALSASKSVLLFPHMNIDGDTLGSAVALCIALRRAGKDAWVLLEDDIPEYLRFLDRGYCSWDMDIIPEPELCVAVDCSDPNRFEKRKARYLSGKTTACVDHHAVSEPFGQVTFVDRGAAAVGEIIYHLLPLLETPLDAEIAGALYVAILTDTGRFQHSNTTAETHRITARLLEAGVDPNQMGIAVYQNISPGRIRINGRALGSMRLFFDGKVSLARVNQVMLRDAGATMDETEGVIDSLRSVNGVEVAVFLKEHEAGLVRVSLRSKTYADVGLVSERFDGGGHKKAAGCTLHCSLDEAESRILAAVKEIL